MKCPECKSMNTFSEAVVTGNGVNIFQCLDCGYSQVWKDD